MVEFVIFLFLAFNFKTEVLCFPPCYDDDEYNYNLSSYSVKAF